MAIVLLAEVKSYLKIDIEDDDTLLNIQIEAAEAYLENATGIDFTSDNKIAKLYLFMLLENMYENRSLVVTGNEKINITAQGLMMQLQHCYEVE